MEGLQFKYFIWPSTHSCAVVVLIALSPAFGSIPKRAGGLVMGLRSGQADVAQQVGVQFAKVLTRLAQDEGAQNVRHDAQDQRLAGRLNKEAGSKAGHGVFFHDEM